MPPVRPQLIKSMIRLPGIGSGIRNVHDAWLRRRIKTFWNDPDDPSRLTFDANRPVLNETQKRVLASLVESGIASVHFSDLFPDTSLYDRLGTKVSKWLNSEKVNQQEKQFIEGAYLNAKWKEYILMMTDEEGSVFQRDDPLFLIGASRAVMDIVHTYFERLARLFHMDVWKTIPIEQPGRQTGSQRWHRDPEDLKLVKVFLYLSDVDQTAGPLHFIKNSCRGHRHGDLWPQRLPYGSVVNPYELESKIPSDECAIITARAGTMVFADTTGLHMGGRATRTPRLFATWGYSSRGSVWPRHFRVAP